MYLTLLKADAFLQPGWEDTATLRARKLPHPTVG